MNLSEVKTELEGNPRAEISLLKDTLSDLRSHVRHLRRMVALLMLCVVLLAGCVAGTLMMCRRIITLETMNITKLTNLMSSDGSH